MLALAIVRHRFRGRGATNCSSSCRCRRPRSCSAPRCCTLFLNSQVVTGFATIFIAHVMFIVSYVVVTVKARLIDFDRHLEEAAMDLGAERFTTFRKITLPLLAPADPQRRAARLRALDRRLRDHLLRRRLDDERSQLVVWARRESPGRPQV
jgi:spermidine/putrescine transport system permease protein